MSINIINIIQGYNKCTTKYSKSNSLSGNVLYYIAKFLLRPNSIMWHSTKK